MSDLTQQFGADSLISKIAATIQASTDTTMYVITVYFGAVGIRNVSYALKVGLLSDIVGVIASVFICMLVFA
jgi:spore maturation protein B